MILIPSYPLGVGFIYVLSCYPILFLGANKGQQSNDLLFSTLLPVRKKDIVLARIITVIIIQVAYMIIMSALYPVAIMIQNGIQNTDPEFTGNPGLGLNGYISLLGIALIGFALADLIFFPIYYKHGKSIVMSTLFTILGFVVYIGVLTIALPLVSERVAGFAWYNQILSGSGIWVQLIILLVAIIVSFVLHILVYRISSKELEKVDF